LELAVGQDGFEGGAVSGQEVVAHLVVLGLAPPRIVEPERDLSAQRIGDLEVAAKEAPGLGTAADRDEVEELDEEPGPAPAALVRRRSSSRRSTRRSRSGTPARSAVKAR